MYIMYMYCYSWNNYDENKKSDIVNIVNLIIIKQQTNIESY